MINIVFFVYSLDSGGLENYLLRFLNAKNKNFEKIFIYCKSGRGGQLENEYSKIENLEIIKTKLGFLDLKAYIKLVKFLQVNKIDTVCDMTGDFAGLVLYSAKKSNVLNRVASYRSSENFYKPNMLKKIYNLFVRNLVLKNATKIVSNSRSAFHNFFPNIWESDKRFKVIYNGINAKDFLKVTSDLRELFGIPKDAFVVGHTGRFTPAKNHTTILKVADILIHKYKNIYFILCGNAVNKNLSSQVKEMGLEDKILLFENRSDVPQFLNTMNCYFFPSITEGQPNALIEAMILGIPYIASDIAPIKETVENEDSLYPVSDINGFINAIENLYQNFDGNICRLDSMKIIERFDADNLFTQFYHILCDKQLEL